MKNAIQIMIEQQMVAKGMKKKDLAAALGMSPENLYARLKTGKFSYDELQTIAKSLDCNLNLAFVPIEK